MRTTLLAIAMAGAFAGCTSPTMSVEQQLEKQGCTVNSPDPRACDPADTMKTTVCHIPPGNPANAHTICVGNPAVPAHLDHGDFVGTCMCTTGDDAGVDDAPMPTDDGSIEVL